MARRGKKGKKRNQKLFIYLSIFAMVGSAFMVGFGRSNRGQSPDAQGIPIRQVSAQPVGQGPVEVEIQGVLSQVIVRPDSPESLSQEDYYRVLQESYQGVSSVELEYSNIYTFFIFYTSKPKEVAESLSGSLRIPGGFKAYPLYYGKSDAGQVDVLGGGLKAGDKVPVLLLQRQSQQGSTLLGFLSQKSAGSE